MSKLWGYLAAFGLFIASVITFGKYNQSIATTRQKLKEAQQELKAREKEIKRHEKNTEIEERVARMSDDDIDAGLHEYYRDDKDL